MDRCHHSPVLRRLPPEPSKNKGQLPSPFPTTGGPHALVQNLKPSADWLKWSLLTYLSWTSMPARQLCIMGKERAVVIPNTSRTKGVTELSQSGIHRHNVPHGMYKPWAQGGPGRYSIHLCLAPHPPDAHSRSLRDVY